MPGTVYAVSRSVQVDQLARYAAEIALRLAALPAEGLRKDMQALATLEDLAQRVLKEVAAARLNGACAVGETRGMWRAMLPDRRQ